MTDDTKDLSLGEPIPEMPWPVTNICSPIHPVREVAIVPIQHARALWKGARMMLAIVNTCSVTVRCETNSPRLIFLEAIDLLQKGVGK